MIPTLCLAGPTATGKSSLALALALAHEGEIVSVDSMQIWRGLGIGTAKPTLAERRQVPHHLIDIADLHQRFDAGRFVHLARQAISAIRKRGRWPILCGGTGLWFRALRHGLDPLPRRSPELTRKLERTPPEELIEELRRADPRLRIDQRNPRRVVRAVEILRLSGRPPSLQRRSWENSPLMESPLVIIHRSREVLRTRISRRIDAMFDRGLVEETRSLLPQGLEDNPLASRALGYRQVIAYLEGEIPLEECRERARMATWQYARRQLTWFRRQPGTVWLDPDRIGPEQIPDDILAALRNSSPCPPVS